MKYRTEIDGLRALSVVGVVLYHFEMLSVSGGFFGVDVFFVISGYLISSLLFDEIDRTGTLSVSNFYLRRTRRILPALLVMCLATYVLFALFVQKAQSPFPHYGDSLLAALFSVSNIFFWLNAGYFALDAWAEPLLHTWSLGVEEQFYIVIPLLLLFLAIMRKRLAKLPFWPFILVLAMASFAFCRWGRDLVGGDFVFYMLPTRLWELAVGVLVALAMRKYPVLVSKRTGVCNVLAALSVLVMCFAFWNYHETTRIAEKALVVTASAALFLLAANERTFVGRLFGSAPFRFVGKISYSWYLWHWPMISLAVMIPVKYPGVSGPWVHGGLLVLSLVMAYLSWLFVEMPFRKKKDWISCIKPLAPLFGLLVVIGMGNSMNLFGSSPYVFEQRYTRGATMEEPAELEKGLIGASGPTPSFVLMGNSHAQSVAPVIDKLAAEYDRAGFFVQDGVLPFLHLKMKDLDNSDPVVVPRFYEFLDTQEIQDILVVARFDHIWEHAEKGRVKYKDRSLLPEEVPAIYHKEMTRFLKELCKTGKRVWIMEQVPRALVDPTIALRVDGEYTEKLRFEEHNALLKQIVAELEQPNLHLLMPKEFFVRDGRVQFASGNELLYFDADHLSVEGAMHIGELFRPFFTAR